MTEKKTTNRKWIRMAAGLAAALVVILGCALGFFTYRTNYAVDATVSLDVNPSLELKVNQKERVLSVEALNEDGKAVLGDMDLKGSDLDVAVNALIGSMLRNGYLSDLANSILVSVNSGDAARSAQMQKRLAQEIDEMLQGDAFSGAVLSQTIQGSADTEALAKQYGVTLGKAQLIQRILVNTPQHTFADLAPLTINELNLLLNAGGTPVEDIDSTGTASDKRYIGEAAAKAAALNHAGLEEAAITGYKWEMDYEHGAMVYDIEFDCDGFEYEYEIDALTGDVLKNQKESSDFHEDHHSAIGDSTGSSTEVLIYPEDAQNAALAHAGVNAADATVTKCALDRENGKTVYEVEFLSGGYEYDYEIDAVSGGVLKSEKEPVSGNGGGTPTTPGQTFIDVGAAKKAALTHAGVNEADATFTKCKQDVENGKTVYEVEFISGGYEYEYEIDAVSGAVLKSEKEPVSGNGGNTGSNPGTPGGSSGNTGSTLIGPEAAKSAAFAHAGVTAAQATNVKCELDRDGARTVYEIEFDCDGYEYEYDIDAVTGAVLKNRKEVDDDYPTGGNSGGSSTGGAQIDAEAAKKIALDHAKTTAQNVWNLTCELDEDDGRAIYEVEFDYNGYEYSYEIDAATGAILDCEIDD